MSLTAEIKPLFKWVGSKNWLASSLKDCYQMCGSPPTFSEAFAGSLSAAFAINPPKVIANDNNAHLINVYDHIKNGLSITIKFYGDEELYYHYRNEFNSRISKGMANTKIAAQLYYFLCRRSFNSLSRFSKIKGHFNSPAGDKLSSYILRSFDDYEKLFQNWEFHANDFEDTDFGDSSFLLADPPYFGTFVGYNQKSNDFDFNEHIRLVNWASKHYGPTVLCNRATEEITKLYKAYKFDCFYVLAPRRIAANGNREPAKEIIAFKNVNKDFYSKFMSGKLKAEPV